MAVKCLNGKLVCSVFTDLATGLILLCLIITYAVMGAFVFQCLEQQEFQYTIRTALLEMQHLREQITADFWNKTFEIGAFTKFTWMEAMKENMKGYCIKVGLLGRILSISQIINSIESHISDPWTFTASLKYTVAVMTTLGSGKHINVIYTSSGKVFYSVFVILGVPLTFCCIYHWAKLLAQFLQVIYSYICCCSKLSKKSKTLNLKSQSTQQDTGKYIPIHDNNQDSSPTIFYTDSHPTFSDFHQDDEVKYDIPPIEPIELQEDKIYENSNIIQPPAPWSICEHEENNTDAQSQIEDETQEKMPVCGPAILAILLLAAYISLTSLYISKSTNSWLSAFVLIINSLYTVELQYDMVTYLLLVFIFTGFCILGASVYMIYLLGIGFSKWLKDKLSLETSKSTSKKTKWCLCFKCKKITSK